MSIRLEPKFGHRSQPDGSVCRDPRTREAKRSLLIRERAYRERTGQRAKPAALCLGVCRIKATDHIVTRRWLDLGIDPGNRVCEWCPVEHCAVRVQHRRQCLTARSNPTAAAFTLPTSFVNLRLARQVGVPSWIGKPYRSAT